MTLAPLLAAPAIVQAHAAFAIAALASGAAIFLSRTGTAFHKGLGRFAAAMLTLTALTSFGITRDGFSVIHLLSAVTLGSVGSAIYAIRHGRRTAHAQAMTGAWVGLAVAGMFTLLPSRIMGRVFFGN